MDELARVSRDLTARFAELGARYASRLAVLEDATVEASARVAKHLASMGVA
jgi:hypothetical protein